MTDKFECKHCKEVFTSEDIFRIHEASCLENQKINGLLKVTPKKPLRDKGEKDKGLE